MATSAVFTAEPTVGASVVHSGAPPRQGYCTKLKCVCKLLISKIYWWRRRELNQSGVDST